MSIVKDNIPDEATRDKIQFQLSEIVRSVFDIGDKQLVFTLDVIDHDDGDKVKPVIITFGMPVDGTCGNVYFDSKTTAYYTIKEDTSNEHGKTESTQ